MIIMIADYNFDTLLYRANIRTEILDIGQTDIGDSYNLFYTTLTS